MFAAATGRFSATSGSGAVSFIDGLTVEAARAISLIAENGTNLSIDGATNLLARGTFAASGEATGGTITITAREGSNFTFDGDLTANATPFQSGGAANGGRIDVTADGATMTLVGDVVLRAQANDNLAAASGDNNGGTATLLAQNRRAGADRRDAAGRHERIRRRPGRLRRLRRPEHRGRARRAWSTFPATSRFPQMASAETPTGPWALSTAAWGMAEPRMSRRMTAPFCSAVALRSMRKASAAAAQVPLVAVRETRAGQAGVAARFSMPCRVEAFRWSASPRFRQAEQAARAAQGGDGVAGLAQVFATDTAAISLADVTGSRAEQARTDRRQTGLAVRARGGVSSFSPKALAISR